MALVFDPPTAPPLPPPADTGANLWELLYFSLGFHVEDDEANGYPLRRFCEGWCAPLQSLYDIVRERADMPAFGILFDVDLCPAACLPYLAQYVGVVLTPEMTEAQMRNEIREPTGWARGREPAIRIAGLRTLRPVGAEPLVFVIRPRTPEPGVHYIRTLASQTPDEERTRAALRAALPAWEVLDYEAFDSATYADIDAAHTTYADADSDLGTYSDEIESGL